MKSTSVELPQEAQEKLEEKFEKIRSLVSPKILSCPDSLSEILEYLDIAHDEIKGECIDEFDEDLDLDELALELQQIESE